MYLSYNVLLGLIEHKCLYDDKMEIEFTTIISTCFDDELRLRTQ